MLFLTVREDEMSIFDAETIWAAAVAIDRINGGYCKEEEFVRDAVTGEAKVTRVPNKVLLKRMLANKSYDDVTDDDREHARNLRHHFNSYLMKELSGKINDFERSVLRIAQMDEFNHRNLLEFAIISCLPNSHRREMKHKAYIQEVIESTPLEGQVGDTVVGDLIIVKCYYNENYCKYRVVGRFGESFVDFWYKDAMEVESTVKIRARIKQHRPDNTTQLNYVKIIKD